MIGRGSPSPPRRRRPSPRALRSAAMRSGGTDPLLPAVGTGERRCSPGPPSLRGELLRSDMAGSAVFDMVNCQTPLDPSFSPKQLQGIVHGVGLSCTSLGMGELLHRRPDGLVAAPELQRLQHEGEGEAPAERAPHEVAMQRWHTHPVVLEILQRRRGCPRPWRHARRWNRGSAVGLDERGKPVARQHNGIGGPENALNTEQWTLTLQMLQPPSEFGIDAGPAPPLAPHIGRVVRSGSPCLHTDPSQPRKHAAAASARPRPPFCRAQPCVCAVGAAW
jgi:hypothetical protein